MLVADVQCNAKDAAGIDILEVYVKQQPHYAIYHTAERALVHLNTAFSAMRKLGLKTPVMGFP